MRNRKKFISFKVSFFPFFFSVSLHRINYEDAVLKYSSVHFVVVVGVVVVAVCDLFQLP